MKGKDKCQLLKAIRRQIAERYGLEYRSEECHHKGECAGTCPRCDAELKDLQWQLEEKGIRDIDLNETMRDKVDKFIQPSVRDEEDNRILQGDVMPPQGSLRLEGMPALPEDRLPAGIPAVPPETGGFVIDDNNNDDEKEDEEDNNEHPVDEDRYFSLPEYYHKIDVQPDDPKGAKAYGFMSENASCILTAYPIRPEDAMDYADEAGLIEGLHKSVDKNQALIEVETGRTNWHKRYIYSIVKTLKENGVQYFVLLHLQRFAEKDLCVKAFYDEQGVTGQREALVYAMLKSDGTLDKLGGLDGWSVDPYDHNFKHDFLMNLSELEQFDESFPNHPLTMARQMIKQVVNSMKD